jgi:hypothetical protein
MTDSAGLGAVPARPRSNEPTLDQLLAEPIVQQLMRRDRIDEATIRHLLHATAAARRKLRADDNLKSGGSPFHCSAAARTERV